MIATVTLNPSLDEWMQLPTVRLGQLNRATRFARYPGGKGVNVSRVIREMGQRTTAYVLAGGADGHMLQQLLSRFMIAYDCVIVKGSTRNNYKIRTEQPRLVTEINTAGPRVSVAEVERLRRRVLSRTPQPRAVALCGSLPPGAHANTYRRWIQALARLRIPAVLDTSGAALRQGLAAHPWVIKPNRQEAEEVLGRRLTTRQAVVRAAQALLARGPAVVILSLGREGAVLATAAPRGVWLATPPAVRVDSAVGAGDSLVGGFLVGWVAGRSLVECFRLGVACGTASVTTSGTELCHRKDVQRLLSRVSIRRIL